jgi:hypothetical protein
MEWISETSSSSRGLRRGKIEGSRAASIDFPAHGGVAARGGDFERALGALGAFLSPLASPANAVIVPSSASSPRTV